MIIRSLKYAAEVAHFAHFSIDGKRADMKAIGNYIRDSRKFRTDELGTYIINDECYWESIILPNEGCRAFIEKNSIQDLSELANRCAVHDFDQGIGYWIKYDNLVEKRRDRNKYRDYEEYSY